MVFLPASLVSSIFGMGFFNTQPLENGSAQFTVSGNWWWYIAISIPVTLALWLSMIGYKYYARKRIEKAIPKSRLLRADVEAQVVVARKKVDNNS
jgi:hypothetical protein